MARTSVQSKQGERSWLPTDALMGCSQPLQRGHSEHNTCLPPTSQCKGNPVGSPKCPGEGHCDLEDSPHQLVGSKFALGEYWSNRARQHRTGTEGPPRTSGTPAPHHLPLSFPRSACTGVLQIPPRPRFGVQWGFSITFRAATNLPLPNLLPHQHHYSPQLLKPAHLCPK